MDTPIEVILYSSASIVTGLLGYLGGHAVNKAKASREVGEAWDKYADNLEGRIATLTKQVDAHTDLISRQNQTIAEQNTTIAAQTSRIGSQDQVIAAQSARITEQDRIIKEQSAIIDDLTCQVKQLGAVPVHQKGK